MRARLFSIGLVASMALTLSCSREDQANLDWFGWREDLITECCTCLADADTPDENETCTADATATECLCGIAGSQCVAELLAEGTGGIRVVGACTQVDGPCFAQCEGVLVYPE